MKCSLASQIKSIISCDSALRSFHPGKPTARSCHLKNQAQSLSLRICSPMYISLVLSSAPLIFSRAQDISPGANSHHSLRNDPTHPSGKILPRYLPAFMKPGNWGIGLTYLSASINCLVNVLSGQSLKNLRIVSCWCPAKYRSSIHIATHTCRRWGTSVLTPSKRKIHLRSAPRQFRDAG